ncbi:GNAT family N-acetyltransferase [Nonomuraea sp. LPB2021202275-12-8]|uniref:GNAT family N-acetyltransferase n=1 Tax=Nonomuraea sp. LPB2021202275-12-8 TaxID=3120159 RepID=UPI00300D2F30
MTVTIRPAIPADATTLRALMRELATHQGQASDVVVSADRLRDLLSSRSDIGYLIAERADRAIGYVSWVERVSLWSGQDYLALDDLYVSTSERSTGVGTQLMHALADASSGRTIRWEVAEANQAAQRFYQRLGASIFTKKICRWQRS